MSYGLREIDTVTTDAQSVHYLPQICLKMWCDTASEKGIACSNSRTVMHAQRAGGAVKIKSCLK